MLSIDTTMNAQKKRNPIPGMQIQRKAAPTNAREFDVVGHSQT